MKYSTISEKLQRFGIFRALGNHQDKQEIGIIGFRTKICIFFVRNIFFIYKKKMFMCLQIF